MDRRHGEAAATHAGRTAVSVDETTAYRGLAVPSERIDVARLEVWLRANVPGFVGPLTVEQFKGGQSNPTYKLSAGSGAYVLRRKPSGALLPSAHAVDREFRVLRALSGSGVPVPEVLALCADTDVVGTMFYVMRFVAGRVFWDQRLPDLDRGERAAIFDSLNATIARLHGIDPAAAGLADFGRPGNYMARQVARWSKQYRAAETTPVEAMDRLIEWLPLHLPPEGETRIVHGDFRLDNVIVHPTEPRVIAVLDWELSTLGDPLGDFAYHMMSWRLAPDLFRGLAGIDFGGLGIPDEAAYLAAYRRRTGIDPGVHWEFYLVYSLFRVAAILQGIAKRALDGTAASAQASALGVKAAPIAAHAWSMAQATMGR
ncbi:MAG: phosphotransferase family protein [Alphaproteobacteria bacterium]|nr:phosphotransferase family protein [Alphaproteobacteria bacterium]